MSWNYRVMRKAADDEVWYEIHEVYYDDSGRPVGCSESACRPFGDTPVELAADVQYFAEALEKPPLDFDIFKGQSEKGL